MKPYARLSLMLSGLLCVAATAQKVNQTTPADGLLLTTTAEAAFTDGEATPYFLTANRHGILSTKANTGYLRAAAAWNRQSGRTRFSAVADLQLQADDYSKAYLQQLAVGAEWRYAYVAAGAWEVEPVLRNRSLSSGATVWSGNARPIPQVRIGTNGFIDIPGTRHWIQVYLDGAYGRYSDDSYIEDRWADYMQYWAALGKDRHGRPNSFMTNKIWHHQKQLFFRTNPEKKFVLTAGLEHAVQFGGNCYNNFTLQYQDFESKVKVKDFLKVLMPKSGDAQDASGDKDFVYGNHLGNLSLMLTYNFESLYEDRTHSSLSFYLENPFEDGSGMAKRNGLDGLWGVEWRKLTPGWLDGIVVEYLQTTDQSGPIHWAPADFGSAYASQLPNEATGSDDYYNNYFFDGYAHHGQAIGSPMLKSPAYNTDAYLRFTDTRVRAFHVGLSGHSPASRQGRQTGYRLLVSYRNSYGTPFISSPHIGHAFCALAELGFRLNSAWHLTASLAFDKGSLYDTGTALDLKAAYSLHLLK